MKNKALISGEKLGCEFCRGEADHKAIGHRMVQEREKMGMAQSELGREMNLSATYICDLEHGRRNWTPQMIDRYLSAVRGIKS